MGWAEMIGRMRDILTPPGLATVGWPFWSPGLNLLARLPTRSGARTSLFVPELGRLFVAARAQRLGSGAAILVFRPEPYLP
jgi:hypothetical protein